MSARFYKPIELVHGGSVGATALQFRNQPHSGLAALRDHEMSVVADQLELLWYTKTALELKVPVYNPFPEDWGGVPL